MKANRILAITKKGALILVIITMTLSWALASDKVSLNERLHDAVFHGDLNKIRELLDKGADIDEEAYGNTPLMTVARKGSVDVVEYLLKRGADPNVKTKDYHGWTALQKAFDSTRVQERSFYQLFTRPEIACNTAGFERVPLSNSVNDGRVAIVKMLLNYGADPNTYVGNGTILMWACVNGHKDIVQPALKKGADVNRKAVWNGNTAIRLAAISGQSNMVKLLKQYGAVNNIHVAAMVGDVKAVENFLKIGVDLATRNDCGRTPLMEAAWGGDTATIRTLLRSITNADLRNSQCTAAFFVAAWRGHVEAVKLLLEQGAEINAVNEQGCTALIEAAWDGNLKVAGLLLDSEADVEAKDGFGKTALDRAIEMGHNNMVELLFSHGAILNVKMELGWTVLDTAIKRSDPAMVKLLCKHGVKTTLNIAAMIGDMEEAQRHLDAGSDINAVDKWGRTALMWATAMGQSTMAKFLLDKGADVNLENCWRVTALDLALARSHKDVAGILISHGAKERAR